MYPNQSVLTASLLLRGRVADLLQETRETPISKHVLVACGGL